MNAIRVRVHISSNSLRGDYETITVMIGDLHLKCDVVNDRNIRLAKRLADAHKADFVCEDTLLEKVKNALNKHE